MEKQPVEQKLHLHGPDKKDVLIRAALGMAISSVLVTGTTTVALDRPEAQTATVEATNPGNTYLLHTDVQPTPSVSPSNIPHVTHKVRTTLPMRPEFTYVPAPAPTKFSPKSVTPQTKLPAPALALPASRLSGISAQSFVRVGNAEYSSLPEAKTRARIGRAMDRNMAQGVHEVPAGSNRGPVVDVYTRQDLNHWEKVGQREWCAGFDSTVYEESDVPLSGGVLYSKTNPDYLLLRAGMAANPHESPHITSVMDWFQANGYFYTNNGHTPETGDAAFMFYYNSTGQRVWHTGLVRRILSNGTLQTYEGNIGGALVKQYYPNTGDRYEATRSNWYIYGFGSFFPES